MNTIDFAVSQNEASPELALFYALPNQVYAGDSLWSPRSEAAVSSLLTSAGPAFIRPVLCLEGQGPLARAVAILHPGALDDCGHPLGYIGCFECLPNRPEAGRAVLDRAEQILHDKGAVTIQAPRVDNMLMGLVVSTERLPQTVLTPHNPPVYAEILTLAGYRVREQLYTYIFDRSSCTIDLSFRIPGIHTRPFDRGQLQREVAIFHHLQNEIFKNHPGWVPRSLDEDRHMINGFLPLLDDDLVIIAEDSQGRPIGLLVCIPDIYQASRGKKVDNVRLINIGALPHASHKGVGVMMGLHLIHNLLAKGYRTLEASWVRDSNIAPQNLVRRFNGRLGRVFALYEKRLA